MRFSAGACMGFLIGWFCLANLFKAFLFGSFKDIFNIAFDGFLGISIAIVFGLIFGFFSRRRK